MRPSLLFVFLSACGGAEQSSLDRGSFSDPGGATRDVSLTVNLIPSRLRDSEDLDSPYRVLPQTVLLPTLSDGAAYDLGEVELLDPVVQTGSVLAYRVNPSVAALPGSIVPVEGSVRLRLPDTVQNYAALSDASGAFDTWAVPGRYRLEIVPNDPLLPMSTDWWNVTGPPASLELDLGPGVPIYGRVSSAASPGVAGARVHVIDPWGARSATAVTDAFGLYQIRVVPGVWTVVCEGRSSGRDPTLSFANQEVGPTGLNLDVPYPSDLTTAWVEGVVEDADNNRLDLATVRLTAETLDEYGPNASWSTDVFVGETGFASPVVPGFYTVEVLPPDGDGDDLTPAKLTGQRLDAGATTLDPIRLGPKIEVTGSVSGPAGEGLASARVTCRELGFDERDWVVFTGEQGNFGLDLPAVPVACEAAAPGGRSDLAIARVLFDPSQSEVPKLTFELQTGRRISGRVVSDGAPESSVGVEVRDESDRLLGVGITDDDGQFSIPVSVGSE